MRFTANIYRIAAAEHIQTALELHNMQRYALSHYVAGLSVECILRAYRHRIGPEFDARHDLIELFKAARYSNSIPESQKAEVLAAIHEVALRWNNNLRYCSENALRVYLRQARANRGIKGNVVKESSHRVIRAALLIVDLGIKQWN